MLVQPEATGSIIGALNRHDLIERLTIQAIRAPIERYSTAFHYREFIPKLIRKVEKLFDQNDGHVALITQNANNVANLLNLLVHPATRPWAA